MPNGVELNSANRFVCSIYQKTSDVVIFPSYYSRTWGASMLDRVKIWEAARATSAASSFFEPLVIDGKTFADGATGANNPVYEMWAEALSQFSIDNESSLETNIKCLVSIGTGVPSPKPFGPGLKDIFMALKTIATEVEATAKQFQRQHPFLDKQGALFRFNVLHGLGDIGLEEADRLGDIEACTYQYCASPTVLHQIETCVEKLKSRPCKFFHLFAAIDVRFMSASMLEIA